jgi:hypothetical protein
VRGQILPEHHLKYNQHLVKPELLKGLDRHTKRKYKRPHT